MSESSNISSCASPPGNRRESLLHVFDELTGAGVLISKPLGGFQSNGSQYRVPRYIKLGPVDGGDPFRLAIFSVIHGDESAGALGLARFIQKLVDLPGIAKGYVLYLYPLCNPTGYEDGTRHNRNGYDLNRLFWKNSSEPEVKILENEILSHMFQGIITLHTDDTSDGVYGYVHGDVLSRHILEPALTAAEVYIPRNQRLKIDGFKAETGIIQDCFEGILRSPSELGPATFEITFETPQLIHEDLQVAAFASALETMLIKYREMMAMGANI
ncbi:MAG: peptidase [Verrucomicrobiales bacterium]|nr:peptidase [Verrucomicrobiales bacterium]